MPRAPCPVPPPKPWFGGSWLIVLTPGRVCGFREAPWVPLLFIILRSGRDDPTTAPALAQVAPECAARWSGGAAEQPHATTGGGPEAPAPPQQLVLPRGDVLLHGGDLAYPAPSREVYQVCVRLGFRVGSNNTCRVQGFGFARTRGTHARTHAVAQTRAARTAACIWFSHLRPPVQRASSPRPPHAPPRHSP